MLSEELRVRGAVSELYGESALFLVLRIFQPAPDLFPGQAVA